MIRFRHKNTKMTLQSTNGKFTIQNRDTFEGRAHGIDSNLIAFAAGKLAVKTPGLKRKEKKCIVGDPQKPECVSPRQVAMVRGKWIVSGQVTGDDGTGKRGSIRSSDFEIYRATAAGTIS